MRDYSDAQHLRFVILDLDKSKEYPANFVCLLPRRLGHKKNTIFEKMFGNQSLEMAEKMLIDALESEEDPEIVDEIRKRLSLLDPGFTFEKVCVSCGIKFQINAKKFKQEYCEDCMKVRINE